MRVEEGAVFRAKVPKRGQIILHDLSDKLLPPEVSYFQLYNFLEILLFRRILEKLEWVGKGVLVADLLYLTKPGLLRFRGQKLLRRNYVKDVAWQSAHHEEERELAEMEDGFTR